MKAFGIDLMGSIATISRRPISSGSTPGRTLSAMDLARDQAIRSEVYDAIQGVLATHEILVSPTLAAMPVDNARRRRHARPDSRRRRGGGPADRLVPDLSDELQWPPVGVGRQRA